MQYIDIKYILKRMVQALWIAVLAGFAFTGAYAIKNIYENRNDNILDVDEITRRRYTFDYYEGDYLLFPEASREIVLPYRFDEDIVSQLTYSNVKLKDYSGYVGDLMVCRIKSGSFTNKFYQRLLDQFPELRKDQKVFNILKFEDEMLSVFIDNSSVLWISIKAPLFLLTESNYEYTPGQYCAYRDALYEMIAEEMEDTEMFSDLSVTLNRVEPAVEESVSEQNLVMKYLKNDTDWRTNSHDLSRKRLVLLFAAGAALAEGIVFLFAVLNKKVKNSEDFKRNTDLEVLDSFSGKTDPDWSIAAVKAAASLENEDKLTVLCEEEKIGWEEALNKALEATEKRIQVRVLHTFKPSPEDLRQMTNAKLLLVVEENVTDYKTLRMLSESLRQIHAVAIGAIVLENHK